MSSANLLNERPVLTIKFRAVNGGNVSGCRHCQQIFANAAVDPIGDFPVNFRLTQKRKFKKEIFGLGS